MQATETKIVNGVNVEQLMETITACKNQPELAQSKFRVTNRWINGGLNRTRIQGFYSGGREDTSREKPFVHDADEPPMLAGENRGANPVEFALTALVACLTTGMVFHAASRGIIIEELESQAEGDIDLRGFMGVAKDVRKGYQNIRVTFRVKSDAPAEQLKEFCQYSPVFDTIRNPVAVTVDVQKK